MKYIHTRRCAPQGQFTKVGKIRCKNGRSIRQLARGKCQKSKFTRPSSFPRIVPQNEASRHGFAHYPDTLRSDPDSRKPLAHRTILDKNPVHACYTTLSPVMHRLTEKLHDRSRGVHDNG